MSEKVSSKTPKERIMDRVYEKSHVSTVSEYGITENEVNTKVVSEAINEEFKGLVNALQKKIKNIEEEQNIWYDPEDQIRLEAYREFLVLLGFKEQKKETE